LDHRWRQSLTLAHLADSFGARVAALKRFSVGAESAARDSEIRRLRDRDRLNTVTRRIWLLLLLGLIWASPELSFTVPATADDVVRLNIKSYSVYAVTLQNAWRPLPSSTESTSIRLLVKLGLRTWDRRCEFGARLLLLLSTH